MDPFPQIKGCFILMRIFRNIPDKTLRIGRKLYYLASKTEFKNGKEIQLGIYVEKLYVSKAWK